MIISIIIPILNEETYIEELVKKIISMSPLDKEVFLVDGGSTDNTIDLIKQLSSKTPNLVFIENKEKYAAQAFNQAFLQTKGKYIAFIGAHADYSSNYFSKGIEFLEQNRCDVVGGVLKQKGNSIIGQVIAACMSSKFGVGDTEFRTTNEEKFVQSVAFAIYKRDIVEKVGLMEPQLIRNQDDEFHYRIVEQGFRILMTPTISAEYYVRNTIPKLFKQYYEYGYYKPLVLYKIRSGIRIRHIIPALFVIYLATLLIALLFLQSLLLIAPIIVYLFLSLYFSIKMEVKKGRFYSILIYPTLHISYGLGFILGVTKVIKDARRVK